MFMLAVRPLPIHWTACSRLHRHSHRGAPRPAEPSKLHTMQPNVPDRRTSQQPTLIGARGPKTERRGP